MIYEVGRTGITPVELLLLNESGWYDGKVRGR